jgi:hypothetical protein
LRPAVDNPDYERLGEATLERWLNDIAIFPTLDDDTRRCRGLNIPGVDADEGPMPQPKRQCAREHYGEPVAKGTIYGRKYRAKLKAARESGSV